MQTRLPVSESRPQALYYASRLASQTGQGLFFALLVVVAGPGGTGAIGLGSVMVAMTVAAIALGPLGGTAVDRLGPRYALPVGAALRFLAIGSAVTVLGHGELAWMVAFIYSAASQVFSPAELALVHRLRNKRPVGTHASLYALQFGGQLIGAFALAPALYWLGGSTAMLGGALFVYAAVVVLAAALSAELHAASPIAANRQRPSGRFRSTLRFIAGEPRALYSVGLLAFVDVTTRCLMIAAPIYLQAELHLGRLQLALLLVAAGAGALLGFGWAARWVTQEQAPRVLRLAFIAILASTFALTPLGDGLTTLTVSGADVELHGFAGPLLLGMVAAVPAAFVLGVATTGAPIIARSVLTVTAPSGQQGRVFAAEAVLSNILVVPALLLASLSTDLVSARATVMFIGIIGSAVFVLLEYRAIGRLAAAPLHAPASNAASPEPDAI